MIGRLYHDDNLRLSFKGGNLRAFGEQIGDEAVISVAEMRAADARTIAGGTPGKVLMGRAAQGIFDAVAKGDVPGFENGWDGKKTVIVCGSGNNGGDGYALASILAREGFDVSLVRASEKLSEDGGYYYEKCREAGIPEIAEFSIQDMVMPGTVKLRIEGEDEEFDLTEPEEFDLPEKEDSGMPQE